MLAGPRVRGHRRRVAVAAAALRVGRPVPPRARRASRAGVDRGRARSTPVAGSPGRSAGRASLAGARRIGRGGGERGSDRGGSGEPAQRRRGRRDAGDDRDRGRRAASRSAPPSCTRRRARTRRARPRSTGHRGGRDDGATSVCRGRHRELGYVEVLRGDYPRARTWLRTAEELADGDPLEISRIRCGHRRPASAMSGRTSRPSASSGTRSSSRGRSDQRSSRRGRWRSSAARSSCANELDLSRGDARRGARPGTQRRWTAFLATRRRCRPRCGSATAVSTGPPRRSSTRSRWRAQVDDACWEAYGVRGLGLLRAARGDLGARSS